MNPETLVEAKIMQQAVADFSGGSSASTSMNPRLHEALGVPDGAPQAKAVEPIHPGLDGTDCDTVSLSWTDRGIAFGGQRMRNPRFGVAGDCPRCQ